MNGALFWRSGAFRQIPKDLNSTKFPPETVHFSCRAAIKCGLLPDSEYSSSVRSPGVALSFVRARKKILLATAHFAATSACRGWAARYLRRSVSSKKFTVRHVAIVLVALLTTGAGRQWGD
jgi:hypothetical protein